MKAKELSTPAKRVSCLKNDLTVGEAFAKMDKSHYNMIPVVEVNSSRYLYSLSNGDILRFILKMGDLKKALAEPLSSVSIDRLIVACNEDVEIEEIFELVANQNYVPLVDANGVFRGIVTRRALINYFTESQEN